MALTNLTLTKDYKVKFSRKESEETTVQRRMEHSWLTTTALRLGARTRARAACFLSPRCLSGTRKDLDISDHLFQSICWIHWTWGPLQIFLFPLSLILSLPPPLPGRSRLSPALKDLSRSAHEEGGSAEGEGRQADARMRMRQGGMSGQVGKRRGPAAQEKGGPNGCRSWCRWLTSMWLGRCERDKPIGDWTQNLESYNLSHGWAVKQLRVPTKCIARNEYLPDPFIWKHPNMFLTFYVTGLGMK